MKGCALTRFGQACRRFRTAAGYTLRDQARIFELSAATIAKIEEGSLQIPEGYIASIAYWLKLDATDLSLLNRLANARRPGMEGIGPRQTNRLAKLFYNLPEMKPENIRGLRRQIEIGDPDAR